MCGICVALEWGDDQHTCDCALLNAVNRRGPDVQGTIRIAPTTARRAFNQERSGDTPTTQHINITGEYSSYPTLVVHAAVLSLQQQHQESCPAEPAPEAAAPSSCNGGTAVATPVGAAVPQPYLVASAAYPQHPSILAYNGEMFSGSVDFLAAGEGSDTRAFALRLRGLEEAVLRTMNALEPQTPNVDEASSSSGAQKMRAVFIAEFSRRVRDTVATCVGGPYAFVYVPSLLITALRALGANSRAPVEVADGRAAMQSRDEATPPSSAVAEPLHHDHRLLHLAVFARDPVGRRSLMLCHNTPLLQPLLQPSSSTQILPDASSASPMHSTHRLVGITSVAPAWAARTGSSDITVVGGASLTAPGAANFERAVRAAVDAKIFSGASSGTAECVVDAGDSAHHDGAQHEPLPAACGACAKRPVTFTELPPDGVYVWEVLGRHPTESSSHDDGVTSTYTLVAPWTESEPRQQNVNPAGIASPRGRVHPLFCAQEAARVARAGPGSSCFLPGHVENTLHAFEAELAPALDSAVAAAAAGSASDLTGGTSAGSTEAVVAVEPLGDPLGAAFLHAFNSCARALSRLTSAAAPRSSHGDAMELGAVAHVAAHIQTLMKAAVAGGSSSLLCLGTANRQRTNCHRSAKVSFTERPQQVDDLALAAAAGAYLGALTVAVYRRVATHAASAPPPISPDGHMIADTPLSRVASQTPSDILVLFSGGLDCTVVAALAALLVDFEHRSHQEYQSLGRTLPPENRSPDTKARAVLLSSVAFGASAAACASTPDRVSAVAAFEEMTTRLGPDAGGLLRLYLNDVRGEEVVASASCIVGCSYPGTSTMDLGIAAALWFAARCVPVRQLLPSPISLCHTKSSEGGVPANQPLANAAADAQGLASTADDDLLFAPLVAQMIECYALHGQADMALCLFGKEHTSSALQAARAALSQQQAAKHAAARLAKIHAGRAVAAAAPPTASASSTAVSTMTRAPAPATLKDFAKAAAAAGVVRIRVVSTAAAVMNPHPAAAAKSAATAAVLATSRAGGDSLDVRSSDRRRTRVSDDVPWTLDAPTPGCGSRVKNAVTRGGTTEERRTEHEQQHPARQQNHTALRFAAARSDTYIALARPEDQGRAAAARANHLLRTAALSGLPLESFGDSSPSAVQQQGNCSGSDPSYCRATTAAAVHGDGTPSAVAQAPVAARVVLVGLGADETLGGYSRYKKTSAAASSTAAATQQSPSVVPSPESDAAAAPPPQRLFVGAPSAACQADATAPFLPTNMAERSPLSSSTTTSCPCTECGQLCVEMTKDYGRLWRRNLGRDDRCVADHGREARFPFLDEGALATLSIVARWWVGGGGRPAAAAASLPPRCVGALVSAAFDTDCTVRPSEVGARPQAPVHNDCGTRSAFGFTDKRLLRIGAGALGLNDTAARAKRAIQFGTRIADRRGVGAAECL